MTKPRQPTKKTLRKPSGMTADSLQNVITGLGTNRSKRSYTQFGPANLMSDWGQLEAAYGDNWLAAAIVDYPADDMTREWRSIKCKDANDIRAEEDRLGVSHKVNDALRWSRLYGGGAILMLTNQDFEKPLEVNRIGNGDLSRLLVLDRWQLYPGAINTWDILAENYLQPEYWSIVQGSQRIHQSHFVFFRGKQVPNRLRLQTQGWGDSELRRCMEELKDAISSKSGIAELMQEANLDVITVQGLADSITTGQEDKITERYAQYGLMKNIFKLSLLDGEEKLDRLTLNLSGVAPSLEILKSFVIGCSGIPATRLFGEQAKGLGNEGAGDLNNYYDNIRAKQNTYLDNPLSYLDQVMVRSAVGKMPSDYNYDWNRLYQPNRKEEAEARKIEAETAILYLEANVIQKSQVMRNLESDELFHFPEGVIDEIEQAEESNWKADDLSEAAKEFEAEQEAQAKATSDAWITVKPNGPDAKGRPVEIDGNGTIINGMGGKFNGQKIGNLKNEKEPAQEPALTLHERAKNAGIKGIRANSKTHVIQSALRSKAAEVRVDKLIEAGKESGLPQYAKADKSTLKSLASSIVSNPYNIERSDGTWSVIMRHNEELGDKLHEQGLSTKLERTGSMKVDLLGVAKELATSLMKSGYSKMTPEELMNEIEGKR